MVDCNDPKPLLMQAVMAVKGVIHQLLSVLERRVSINVGALYIRSYSFQIYRKYQLMNFNVSDKGEFKSY